MMRSRATGTAPRDRAADLHALCALAREDWDAFCRNVKTIYSAIRNGQLVAIRIGRVVRVPLAAVIEAEATLRGATACRPEEGKL